MLPREMRTDVMPGAFNASLPADDPVEAAEVPTLPTQDELKKAVPVALSLIKPASTLTQATVLKAQAPRRKADSSSAWSSSRLYVVQCIPLGVSDSPTPPSLPGPVEIASAGSEPLSLESSGGFAGS